LLFAGALFAFLVVMTWNDDRAGFARESSLAATPARVLARQYYDFARQALPACYQSLRGPDAELTQAIIAVESTSVGSTEFLVERYAFPVLSHLLGRPLDWSIGPGQLRASTLVDAAWPLQDVELATLHTLIDTCRSIHASHWLVGTLRTRNRGLHGSDSADRVAVIRTYNGQLTSSLENDLYVSVVLAVLDHIRALASSGMHLPPGGRHG